MHWTPLLFLHPKVVVDHGTLLNTALHFIHERLRLSYFLFLERVSACFWGFDETDESITLSVERQFFLGLSEIVDQVGVFLLVFFSVDLDIYSLPALL